MKQVAIIGIQGVPAKYGGFETLVENFIGKHCSGHVQYTIFCSAKDSVDRPMTYRGAQLRYVPFFRANGVQSIPYDILSLCFALRGFDTVLILGVSGCIFLPIFRLLFRGRIVINIDGLEHQRAKWGRVTKWFLRMSEALAVRYADAIVADNKGIQDYISVTYGKHSQLIAYGGDHVLCHVDAALQERILSEYHLTPDGYAISVCRIEPENNTHLILEAFARSGMTLVFVGNWQRSRYSRSLRKRYSAYPNIRCVEAVYQLDVLYTLRRHCRYYIHGHSAGGTNPSLVEAMQFGKPILAYDVVYNRETTEHKAHYFKTASELEALLIQAPRTGEAMAEIAQRRYYWQRIAGLYEALY